MSTDKISKNKFVILSYEIFDDKSELVEKPDEPVNYIHGQTKKLLKKIEESIEGKTIGDMIEVLIKPEDGFGEYDEALIYKDKIDNVPENFRKLNEVVAFQNEKGEKKEFKVVMMDDKEIILDGNHYLSGKTLLYKIKILDVRESTPYDLSQNQQV